MKSSSASPDRNTFVSRRFNVLHLGYLGAVCGALLACSNQREANEPSAAPAMTEAPPVAEASPQPPAQAQSPEAEAEPREEAAAAAAASVDARALDRFVSAVEPLGTDAMDRSHETTVEALRAFAGALATLPAVDVTATDEVRSTAEQLASSHPSSLEHADMVKQALETGLSALSAQDVPAGRQAPFQDAGRTLRGAVEAIDAQEPLLQ